MASSRKTTRVITQVTKQADDQQDLVAALRGLGVSDSRIKLFRYANYPARPEYIDDIELEIVTTGSLEQFLKEKYGAGSYLARGFANGQWVKDGSRVIHIYGEKKEEPAKNGNGDDKDVWRFMMTMQQQSSDRMMTLMQNSNNTMMQVFTAIVAGQKPLDLAGIAAMMQQLKPPGGMNETIEMMTKVVDLTSKLGGGASDAAEPDPMMMMLGAGLDLIKNRSALPPAQPQQQHPQPPGAPAAAAPVQNPPQQQNAAWSQQKMLEDRLRFLEMLKKKAELGKDPEEWANYIEDNQDEAVCVWLLSTSQQHPWETIAGALTQTDPQLGQEPYATWFRRLYDLLTGEDAGGGDDASRTVHSPS